MHYQLDVMFREQKGKGACRKLRSKGLIPGIIYGHKIENLAIAVDNKALMNMLKKAGESSIIELNIPGKEKLNALIKDYYQDPLTDKVLHVDFYAIHSDEVISLNVPLHFKGEPVGVKQGGGVLEIILREIEIECFPADIPESIEIDLSTLNIGDEILVSDLKLMEKIRVITKPSSVIALVSAPTVEEVEKAAAEAEIAEPEVIKKGKEIEEPEEEK